eukprot:TRINITY_DN2554_c0_g1_i2.p1 TRINITY_DN2554_c0_g1~~TRINITY_DN2554_c0_g1_i2.p1  ORF type:complete len:430 (-),score=68.90 TRINITY_DN2554_c0_g1_i2:39-1328(-)
MIKHVRDYMQIHSNFLRETVTALSTIPFLVIASIILYLSTLDLRKLPNKSSRRQFQQLSSFANKPRTTTTTTTTTSFVIRYPALTIAQSFEIYFLGFSSFFRYSCSCYLGAGLERAALVSTTFFWAVHALYHHFPILNLPELILNYPTQKEEGQDRSRMNSTKEATTSSGIVVFRDSDLLKRFQWSILFIKNLEGSSTHFIFLMISLAGTLTALTFGFTTGLHQGERWAAIFVINALLLELIDLGRLVFCGQGQGWNSWGWGPWLIGGATSAIVISMVAIQYDVASVGCLPESFFQWRALGEISQCLALMLIYLHHRLRPSRIVSSPHDRVIKGEVEEEDVENFEDERMSDENGDVELQEVLKQLDDDDDFERSRKESKSCKSEIEKVCDRMDVLPVHAIPGYSELLQLSRLANRHQEIDEYIEQVEHD